MTTRGICRFLLTSCAAFTSVLACGTDGTPTHQFDVPPTIDPTPEAPLIDDYIRSLQMLSTAPPSREATNMSAPQRQGDYSCTTEDISETRNYDRVVALAANSNSLWPGALIDGSSVAGGLFTEAVFPRQQLAVSISLENLTGKRSVLIEHPSLSAYRDAVGALLEAQLQGESAASIYSQIEQVHSSQQLSLAMGIDASWGLGAASLSAGFDFSQSDVRSRFLVDFTQAYYTVDLDAPGVPSDVFGSTVTLAQVQERFGAANPPMYVASITYGRKVIFTVESKFSSTEMGAALEFAYRGGASVDGSVSLTHQEVLSQSKITAFILGGSGVDAVRAVEGYEQLLDYIRNGGSYSRDSPGAPIAYKIAYLATNEPAKLALATEYQVRDCVRVNQKVRVTLESLTVEAVGTWESDSDLEVFGTIDVSATSWHRMFDRGPNNYLTIAEGATYPQSGSLAEVVVDVTPVAGQQIRFAGELVDYDSLSANDSLGTVQGSAPFESGWRRELSTVSSYDGSIVRAKYQLLPMP